jgi:hypothetical protein
MWINYRFTGWRRGHYWVCVVLLGNGLFMNFVSTSVGNYMMAFHNECWLDLPGWIINSYLENSVFVANSAHVGQPYHHNISNVSMMVLRNVSTFLWILNILSWLLRHLHIAMYTVWLCDAIYSEHSVCVLATLNNDILFKPRKC